MHVTSLRADLATIVAAQTNVSRFDAIESDTVLATLGFDAQALFAQLGVGRPEGFDGDRATFNDLVDVLQSEGDRIEASLTSAARDARVRRLVQAMLVIRRQVVPAQPDRLLWNDLVSQVLWWTAREVANEGLPLVLRGAPARGFQALAALGLLETSVFREASDRSARTVLEVLGTCGYPAAAAVDAWVALGKLAHAIQKGGHAGSLQHLVRAEVEQLAGRVERELVPEPNGNSPVRSAVRTWLRNTTGLPLPVFSPSTREFVEKFRADGLTQDPLVAIGDRIGFPLLDAVVSDFMDTVCRTCEPGDPNQRRCVTQLGGVWQVECVRRQAPTSAQAAAVPAARGGVR